MTVYRRTPATLFADIDEDIVALHTDRGVCFGMEGVTAEVWKMLDEPRDEAAICARLMELFDVDRETCVEETAELLRQMEAEQLIERAPA